MPAIPAQELFELSKCYLCYGVTQAQALELALLNLIAENGGGPLVYRAILNQTGTNAPVATVLQNDLAGTPVWSRIGSGAYEITLAGALPLGKTFFSILTTGDPGASPQCAGAAHVSADTIAVLTGDVASNTSLDDVLIGFPFEILVYP